MCVCVRAQSCLTLCDHMDCRPQTPLSTEFSRQEYWSRLPFPTPGDHLDPGTEPASLRFLHCQEDSLPLHYLESLNMCHQENVFLWPQPTLIFDGS